MITKNIVLYLFYSNIEDLAYKEYPYFFIDLKIDIEAAIRKLKIRKDNITIDDAEKISDFINEGVGI